MYLPTPHCYGEESYGFSLHLLPAKTLNLQELAEPPESSKSERLKLWNVIKQRLQLAEQGRWDVLLKHYQGDLEKLTSQYKAQISRLLGI